MIRTLFVFATLLAAPTALACGGAKCAHCAEPAPAASTGVEAAAGTKVTLAIAGMTCGGCSGKVLAALTGTEGVNAASVDHATGRAVVAYDEARLDVAALIAAVASAGTYVATVVVDES